MAKYIENTEPLFLPLVALRGAVAFPSVSLSFELSDEESIAAVESAFETNSPVFVCALSDPDASEISPEVLCNVGTVSKIKQSYKTQEGNMRIVTEGVSRATLGPITRFANYFCANVIARSVSLAEDDALASEAYCRAIITSAENLTAKLPSAADDMLGAARTIKNPAMLADFIASNLLVKISDKQKVLASFNPISRIELILALLREEADLLDCEIKIHKKVRAGLSQAQREHYLREQQRAISEELGEGDDEAELVSSILGLKCPEELRQKLLSEYSRMRRMPSGSSEAAVIRTYIETCLEIPWASATKDRLNIAAAQKILDEDHDGLEKVKERILEYLAVKQLNPELKNQIICLVGPPGVGKTSVAASIARAMKRKYVRVSLGGVRDEADIRGHRKTYVASMPGRIVNGLIQAKVKNPLMLLDEIDKLTRDAHGDPSSALLEVLDAEQNHAFRDHFVEYPIDLSDCLFIATANTLDTVPKPLLDRMEVIELKSYTRTEKIDIAKHHLIPKQLKRHGLTRKMLTLNDAAIAEIIDFYTREAGVRSLERTIAELARKAAKKFVENSELKTLKITAKNLSDFLGPRKLIPETISAEDEVGVVNGLAYTETGGDVLKVEVAVLEGSGKLELTGSLGDVMKESAKIAVSLVRSIADEYGIERDFYKTRDIHIHFPEGAVPKDGPSAGVTMLTALVSALCERAVRRDIAMTGEISLRGRVLPIGGLKEKTMAALSYGVREVLIPEDNMRQIPELDRAVREGIKFIPCKNAHDVLSHAIVSPALPCTHAQSSLSNAQELADTPICHGVRTPARAKNAK